MVYSLHTRFLLNMYNDNLIADVSNTITNQKIKVKHKEHKINICRQNIY